LYGRWFDKLVQNSQIVNNIQQTLQDNADI
jgi:hypothetical protein